MDRLRKIRGCIFDLDGTLLDSMNVWEDIDKKFLGKRGIAVPLDYLDAVGPLGFYETAVYTIRRFDLKDETPEELMDEWRDMARYAYAHEVRLKRGVKEYLFKLKERNIKLGVATAAEPELFVSALKNNGVYDLFDAFATTYDVSRGKGYPDIYLAVSGKLALDPYECAVFEDIFLGIQGAKDGGFLTVAVYDPRSSDISAMKRISDIYINSFDELL